MFFKTNSVQIVVYQKKKFFLGLKNKANRSLILITKSGMRMMRKCLEALLQLAS